MSNEKELQKKLEGVIDLMKKLGMEKFLGICEDDDPKGTYHVTIKKVRGVRKWKKQG